MLKISANFELSLELSHMQLSNKSFVAKKTKVQSVISPFLILKRFFEFEKSLTLVAQLSYKGMDLCSNFLI